MAVYSLARTHPRWCAVCKQFEQLFKVDNLFHFTKVENSFFVFRLFVYLEQYTLTCMF